ncbi:MAG: isoprenoid biosynthesis glyoxalase ElbB [Bacteroidetes bacterium]|nr:isoprenoid biosynthesis glyoxalase ElbB [Bacteroidota bacterium]MBL6964038.1 isoprenoid biosynthesis glyoxalase ElbB [Bacteroidota bacterium]
MKKIAVVLSGNGVYDGSEIHEAVLSLYAIQKAGAEYSIFAPDIPQHHVVNHLTGEEMKEKRNVLVESARIARGKISPLSKFNADDFDALLLPGGFGAAKNLSTFAFDGADCDIHEEVANSINGMIERNKPIGALCISPVILAKLVGKQIELTIGSDKGTAEAVTAMGASHQQTDHGEIVVDKKYKVVTTPCYMLDASIAQIGTGAENVVNKLVELI